MTNMRGCDINYFSSQSNGNGNIIGGFNQHQMGRVPAASSGAGGPGGGAITPNKLLLSSTSQLPSDVLLPQGSGGYGGAGAGAVCDDRTPKDYLSVQPKTATAAS